MRDAKDGNHKEQGGCALQCRARELPPKGRAAIRVKAKAKGRA